MLSENKLKILENFMDSASPSLKESLNNLKPELKDVDEKIFLKITNLKFKTSGQHIIIGIYNENIKPTLLYLLEDYNDNSYGFLYTIEKEDYDEYKKQLRLKKLNKITK